MAEETWRSMFFGGDGSVEARTWHPGSDPAAYDRRQWSDSIGWKDGKLEAGGVWWVEKTLPFMSTHYEAPMILGLVYYLFVVVFLQRYMKNREAYSLKLLLSVWNFLLAGFSLWGTVVLVPRMFNQILEDGGRIRNEMCTMEVEYETPVVYLFVMSKVPELIDTVFLALRKRPIIFLHWYHHIATMLYCWDAWANGVAAGGWFAAMNLTVHAIMYTYYFVMSLNVFGRAPAIVAMGITSLQIIQMIGGLAVLVYVLQNCPSSVVTPDHKVVFNLWAGIAMYFSYAALFINFFVQRYIRKRHPTAAKANEAKKTDGAKQSQSPARRKATKVD
jgi:elongation of very long chain fatty acids protein 6